MSDETKRLKKSEQSDIHKYTNIIVGIYFQ